MKPIYKYIIEPLMNAVEVRAIEYLNDKDLEEETAVMLEYISNLHEIKDKLGSIGREVKFEVLHFIMKARIDSYSTGLEFLIWSTKNPSKKFDLSDKPKEVRDLFVNYIGLRLAMSLCSVIQYSHEHKTILEKYPRC